MTTLKQKITTRVGQTVVAIAAMACAGPASATMLISKINMDNGYVAYLSTSDSVAGTPFGSGNDWPTTFKNLTTLAAGVNYFLHVYGYDQGGPAGFLGEFYLSGGGHLFANGQTTLLTNTTDWVGNGSGFNGTYSAVNDYGANGVGPWGYRGAVSGAARWIWHGNNNAPNEANNFNYFSTRISAVRVVPEPASLALVGIGLVGLVAVRRRQGTHVKA